MKRRPIGPLARCAAITLTLTVALLFSTALAQAAPPTNLTVGQDSYYLTASWTLPAGMDSHSIEVATSPDIRPDGTFVARIFGDVLGPTQTTFRSISQFAPGTYYVHVGAVTAGCVPPSPCIDEFSEVKSLTIPNPPPPTLNSVGQAARRFTASWTLGPGTQTALIEAATSPATRSDGFFPDETTRLYDETLGPTQTTYQSPVQFPPGVYYVHVAAYDPTCFSCFSLSFSNTLPVTIADPPPPPPPPPPADTITAFASLNVKSSQKAGNIVVQVSMIENGTIAVGGTVSVPNASKVYRLKSVSVKATAGKTVKIKVKLPKKALKAAKKALKRRKRVNAKLTITAKDAAGNKKVEKRTVRLKR